MDVLAIILACSLHPDDQLVRVLVTVQSRANVFFVGDLSTLRTNDSLGSTAAALHFAEELERSGGRPAVGLLGVPLAWASRYGLQPGDLFDACTNIAIGTAALDAHAAACAARGANPRPRQNATPARVHGPNTRRALRACLLEAFAKDLGLTGSAAAVLSAVTTDRPEARLSDPPDDPCLTSPVVPGDGPVASQQLRSVFLPDSSLGPRDPR